METKQFKLFYSIIAEPSLCKDENEFRKIIEETFNKEIELKEIKEMVTDEKLIYELYERLSIESYKNCDDELCDDEYCVLYKALKNVIKYQLNK